MGPLDREQATEVTETLQSRLVDRLAADVPVDRRSVLGGLGTLGGAAMAGRAFAHDGDDHEEEATHQHGNFGPKGEFNRTAFDPHEFLTAFNTGEDGQDIVPQRRYEEDGRTVREFDLTATDVTIEVAPGVDFPVDAWAFNGQVPGPTLRVVEGDLVRITFSNASKHAHTIHPHLINTDPVMDGVPQNGPGVIDPGEEFTYEWVAQPAGVHFYHCHAVPLKAHIHRGLYGMIIVDPDPERVREHPREYVNYHGPMTDAYVDELVDVARTRNHEYPEQDAVNELVMMMNGFDINFDEDNEIYAVNTRAFAYGIGSTDGKGSWEPGETMHPIRIDRNELQRVYLVNATEFDPINSFHSHSQFFDYYDHGTTLYPTLKNVDTIMQCQAQRGIIELDYSEHEPGLYMFHAHQSEFAEQGWMSFFEVTDG
ncbi:MAG: multicopper oxidase domain-containing protein [Halobacteriota archaeon]